MPTLLFSWDELTSYESTVLMVAALAYFDDFYAFLHKRFFFICASMLHLDDDGVSPPPVDVQGEGPDLEEGEEQEEEIGEDIAAPVASAELIVRD